MARNRLCICKMTLVSQFMIIKQYSVVYTRKKNECNSN